MSGAEIVKDLYSPVRGGSACLVRVGDKHYRISSIPAAPDHGDPETLAFACDEDGEVTDWADLAGGRGKTREETIAELERGENPYGWSEQATVADLLGVMRVAAFGAGPGYYKEEGEE